MDINSYISYDNEVYIYYIDMPYSVTSTVVENPDGSYTLYLNSRLTYEKNIEGYLHEMRHLDNNDLDNCLNVQDVELNVRR